MRIGDKYILQNGADNPTPMKLLKRTETYYVFKDGASIWGGLKESVEKLVSDGVLNKVISEGAFK